MEFQRTQWLTELKSAFFKCLEIDGDKIHYDQIIKELLIQVKDFLGAEEVAFYRHNQWKKQLFLEATTDNGFHKYDEVLGIMLNEVMDQLKEKDFNYQCHPIQGLERYQLILPLTKDDSLIGIMAVKQKENNESSLQDPTFHKALSKECTNIIQVASNILKIVAEEKRYKQLFRVTEKFHSSMNMDDVLREIIYTLQEVYPLFTYFLLLSHDNNHHDDLPIKDLEDDNDNIVAMQAYVTGTIQLEDSLVERSFLLYAPLKGRQGVYGVLQVISPNTLVFPRSEVEFITLLAYTAGSAIENAQLYQQSKRLIADLQLINETSHNLNSNLRLSETMGYMRDQIRKSFNAEEIGFVMYTADNEVKVLHGSSSFFNLELSSVYIQFIKEKIDKEKEAIFLGDLQLGDPDCLKYRSVMAVPMIQSGVIKGFALVIHSEPYQFSFEMFKLLQSLIHHSTLAFTNSILREELERMVVTDHLTKLYSRNYLDEKLTESMKYKEKGTFLLLDIDNFKSINDTYGHQVGDEILIQVSNAIIHNIRSTDIGARWGGEELAIYLPNVDLEIGMTIAERIRRKVEEETNPQVTVSCGISYWNTEQEDHPQALFKRADTALYEAKNSGKNKIVIANHLEKGCDQNE
ncbi:MULTISPECIES: sensor domain-containing diguanylate cyclase [Bacillus]|uniref:sensor domain-containing diguanylate cyclase n=1 Tax=Bacillus TaxID=1386 RepID=UPI0003054268|nr:diguanylate cyclase [Bacillus sp. AP8]